MFIRNRQPVLCQSCGVWINTNHVVEQACERAQGPHLQCNRCLSYNGQNRGPSNSRPNLQRPPPQSGNRPSLPSQPSSGMNNAGIAQSSNIVNRDGQFAASLFPRRSYFPPQTARMPTSHGQNRAEAAPGPTNLQTQRQIGTGHDTASNPPPRMGAPSPVVTGASPFAPGRSACHAAPQQNMQRQANMAALQQAGNRQMRIGSPLTLPHHVDELSQQDERIMRMVAEFELDADQSWARLAINNQGMTQRAPETMGNAQNDQLYESDNEQGPNAPENDGGVQEGSKRKTRRGTRAGRQVQIRRERALRQLERHQQPQPQSQQQQEQPQPKPQQQQPQLQPQPQQQQWQPRQRQLQPQPQPNRFPAGRQPPAGPRQPPVGPRNQMQGPHHQHPNDPGRDQRRFRQGGN